MRIAKDTDDETGEMFDCDGDRARDSVWMYGAEIYLEGSFVKITGFVRSSEEYSDSEYKNFHIEEWLMLPRTNDDWEKWYKVQEEINQARAEIVAEKSAAIVAKINNETS